MHPARRFWTHYEPIHALVYFAPEKVEAYRSAGLRGGWMGYFASRAAAMGPVDAPVVAATFHNFAPGMVARAIPDAWTFSTPERVLAARLAAVDGALRRLWGDAVTSPDVAEAAGLLARVVAAALDLGVAGRPLFAAHAALPVPSEPHLALWHWCTVLREHRFDGHVAVQVMAGIDGCEALVTGALSGVGPGAEEMRAVRGWSAEDWAAAESRLRARGLLDSANALTPAGASLRATVEDQTDGMCLAPWSALDAEEQSRLLDLLRPLAAALVAEGGITYPNYTGAPQPA